MQEITLTSRAEGVAVGAATGDLLGSTIEGYDLSTPVAEQAMFEGYSSMDPNDSSGIWRRKAGDMIEHIQSRGGYVKEYMGHLGTGFWNYGETTDDTGQWVPIAQTLVGLGKFNPEAISQVLLRWYDRGYARGLGGTSLLAFRQMDPDVTNPPKAWFEASKEAQRLAPTFVKFHDQPKGFEMQMLPANGAAMRTSMLGVFTPLREDYDRLADAADKLALITHDFPECRATAQIISELTARLVNGEEKRYAAESVSNRYPQYYDLSMASTEKDVGYGGSALETTGIAIASLLRGSTARDVIEIAVNATTTFKPWATDVDTHGAVAGALAGAHYGYEAIPESWQYPVSPKDHGRQYELSPYPVSYLRELGAALLLGAS